MENGLYSLRVLVGAIYTTGLIVLRDRCINGGDTDRIYQGLFTQSGSQIAGTLTVTKWSHAANGLAGAGLAGEQFKIELSGTTDSRGFHMVGLGQAGAIVEVSGHLLADLIEPCCDRPEVVHNLASPQDTDPMR